MDSSDVDLALNRVLAGHGVWRGDPITLAQGARQVDSESQLSYPKV